MEEFDNFIRNLLDSKVIIVSVVKQRDYKISADYYILSRINPFFVCKNKKFQT